MNEIKKEYFPNLDGLRFVCFLLVFFHHSFHTEVSEILNSDIHIFLKKTLFANGNLGVNFFFVLSGFLITHLLIQERLKSSSINVKNFWIRRILRIWPLYYFCVFFGFFIFPFIKNLMGAPVSESATLFSYVTFTNNFEFIEKGLPDASILGVLWSIAIEEQFYFVWPIILMVISIRNYWIVFSAIILLSVVFRYFNLNYMMHEYHTLSFNPCAALPDLLILKIRAQSSSLKLCCAQWSIVVRMVRDISSSRKIIFRLG
jgi:peptidoglycan/LPS O-acetylase OafA/YrhL